MFQNFEKEKFRWDVQKCGKIFFLSKFIYFHNMFADETDRIAYKHRIFF